MPRFGRFVTAFPFLALCAKSAAGGPVAAGSPAIHLKDLCILAQSGAGRFGRLAKVLNLLPQSGQVPLQLSHMLIDLLDLQFEVFDLLQQRTYRLAIVPVLTGWTESM